MFICKRCCCTSKQSSCCSNKELNTLSSSLAILSVRSRLEILFFLKDTPHCVCDLEAHTGMSQSLISHHLADLETIKLVTSKRDGKYVDYFLTAKGRQVVTALETVLNA